MKKWIAMVLALVMMAALIPAAMAEGNANPDREPPKVGMLSFLSIDEENYIRLVQARTILTGMLEEQGYLVFNRPAPPEGQEAPKDAPPAEKQIGKVVYFENLNEMVMGLQNGTVEMIEVYQSVAKYLAAHNPELEVMHEYDMNKEQSVFVQRMMNSRLGNTFSFLVRSDNQALADEFNEAIKAMKEDGTLDKLVKEQIDGAVEGEPEAVEIPEIAGAEKIKVAVTGSLPPMDYVSADGKAAGFNTAVLAEISNRIGKSIEIVVVDGSMARAMALSSGAVDVVFWTRTNGKLGQTIKPDGTGPKFMDQLTEEEKAVFEELQKIVPVNDFLYIDLPEDTISTEPYYTDVIVPVTLKREAPAQ